MVDRRRIVRQWQQGGAEVLITLVGVEGSSYRKPGAHLLVAANGEFSGTISGGCLETEVVRKASWMVRDGARVERYSTMFDDTAEVPFGLGCGGVVDVLFEPTGTPECSAYIKAMEASLGGAESFVVTYLPVEGGPLARTVSLADRGLVFASAGLDPAQVALVRVTNHEAVSETGRIFSEAIRAPQRLFVLGAGDDAKPVVTMAALLGWNVTVVDGRAPLARPERFPEAELVIAINSVEHLAMKAADAVVIMTHSYEQDRFLLTGLLADEARPGYIGLLGAAHRSCLLVNEAAAAIDRSVAECCERVYAPVGLDLGGDGPEAIALAVIAQVQAWMHGRLGASRRLTAEQVAEQVTQSGASRYLQSQCVVGAPAPIGS